MNAIAGIERPRLPAHDHVAWPWRRFGCSYQRKPIDAEPSELILFHARWDLLRAHLLVPALGAALTVQERQSGVDQLRCEAHFVVRQVRQNREPVLRHVLPLPAGILQSTAEQLVELHLMLRPKHVAVAVDE